MIPGLAALLAGGLLPLALAPFDLWPAAFISLAVWFYLLQETSGRGMLLGWLFGVGKYGVGVSWVYVSIHVHGNAPPLLAAALVALFVAGLALFPMANAWLFRRFHPGGWMAGGCSFVILFCGFEWLLTWFLTGFPWLYPGYGFLDTPLAGFAPIGGVQLIGLLIVAAAVVLATLARGPLRRSREWWAQRGGRGQLERGLDGGALRLQNTAPRWRLSSFILGGCLLIAPWPLGLLLGEVRWTQPLQRHDVALVQGNVEQQTKWLPESRGPIIDRYLELSESHWGVDLLVWPEAAITLFAHEAEPLLAELEERGLRTGTGLVLGIPALERLADNRVVFRNTAIGLGTARGRYVKRRLVPFGEYVPLESLLRGLIEFFDLPMSRAEPGAWQQSPLRLAGTPAQLAICYEVVYPQLMRDPQAGVLLTISNDTWFGASLGPLQHLQMARMRALENGRWLLRATNNGVTAIVDPEGRVRGRLPQFATGVLEGEYEDMAGRTPYNRFGETPLLALLLGLGFLVLRLRKDKK